MHVSLSPEVRKFIEDRIRTGQYSTPEEVIQEAIARLQSDEEWAALDLDDPTLAAIEESEAQYQRGEFRDLKDVAADLRARYSRK